MRILVRMRRGASRMRQWLLDRRTPIQQWEARARRHGTRAVLDLGHSEAEVAQVTEFQRKELYPLFRAALRGDERLILDFGCGPGRFTSDLGEMIGGRAIGVDPIQSLLDLAPRHPRADYRLMTEGHLPVSGDAVDAVWVCLVLGGIHGRTLEATVSEIHRVLRPGGLLFLVENTTEGGGSAFWAFRSVAEYQTLLAPIPLEHIHDYQDLGQQISVMTGRKPVASPGAHDNERRAWRRLP